MGAIINGMALSKVRPYGSTFLIFSDYCAAIRLGAIMELPVIYIFTHDSIGVGEDGPTHQPIEHLAVAAGDSGPDHCCARRRQRSGRSLAGRSCSCSTSRSCWCSPGRPADARPHQVRRRVGAAQGRLCARRRAGRQAGLILMGTGSEVQCASTPTRSSSGRRQGPRGQHAVVGAVRAADAGISRQVLPPGVTARVAVEAA